MRLTLIEVHLREATDVDLGAGAEEREELVGETEVVGALFGEWALSLLEPRSQGRKTCMATNRKEATRLGWPGIRSTAVMTAKPLLPAGTTLELNWTAVGSSPAGVDSLFAKIVPSSSSMYV